MPVSGTDWRLFGDQRVACVDKFTAGREAGKEMEDQNKLKNPRPRNLIYLVDFCSFIKL